MCRRECADIITRWNIAGFIVIGRPVILSFPPLNYWVVLVVS